MVPQTYPSILNPYTNRHEMVVKQLASTSGLQRWTDYIPVKLSASTRPAGEQTTDGDGFIAINTSQNTSTGVAFKDWVPVYFDNDATDAWVVSASGYIPIGASGGAIAILKSYGTDAHVYLPGANGVAVSGLPTNNYTLSNGSTGHSAVDGTAGLVLDGAGSVGAELIGDAGFDSDAYWQKGAGWSVSGSSAVRVSSGSFSNINPVTNTITTAGKTYIATAVIDSISGGDLIFAGMAGGPVMNTPGIKQFIFVASGVSVYLQATSGPVAATVSSFSIKEVTGIHATQATTANKPALRGGLYNLLTYSNDLSNAAWVAENTGSKSGNNILTPAVGDDVYHGTTVAAGSYTLAAQLSGTGTCSLFAYNATNGIHGVTQITLTNTPTIFVAGITSTVANTFYYIGRRTGDTATSITFGGAGLFQGTLTAQQILAEGGIPLTTSTAASNPSAGRYSWQFDGSNDSLALGSVPFQMSDDHCVIAGFRADAMGKVVVIPGSNVTGHRIAAVMTEGATGKARVSWWDGTNHNVIDSGSSVVGSTIVVAGRKVSSALVARLNGSQFGTATATATFVPDRAYIGTSDGGAYAHSGAIGPVILIKGTISDSDLLTLERWVAANTLGAPSF